MKLLDRLESMVFYQPPTCFWSGGDSSAENTESGMAGFNSTLRSSFATQFAAQSAALNFLTGKLQSQIDNPTGIGAAAMAGMRTSAADAVAANFQAAKRANQNVEFSRGGEFLPSGVNAQINAGLTTSAAQANAEAQNSITQQDEQLKQQNYWNATNSLLGVTSQENPLGYAGEATNSANAVTGLSQAVTAAKGPTWGSILGGALTGAATGIATGGMSNLGKGVGFFG